MEKEKIKISENSRIRIYWEDDPFKYTKDNKNIIKERFSERYGINKKNIEVVFHPKLKNVNEKSNNLLDIGNTFFKNTRDLKYHHELFKECIERNVLDVNFDEIKKIDEKVNSLLDIDLAESNIYKINWIELNGFLSYGYDNFLNFKDLNGLIIVNSIPSNQGGKTTLCIESLKFLFFGKTNKANNTTQIFNKFINGEVASVKGSFNINGEEYIIERSLTRTKNKSGRFNKTIKSKVNFYKKVGDEIINMNDEDSISTSNKIKNIIGNENDFEFSILTTLRNIDDFISLGPTELTRIINKYIGLDIIEKKEQIAKDLFNKFSKKLNKNLYSIDDLKKDIENLNKDKTSLEDKNKELNVLLEKKRSELKELEKEKEDLIYSKKPIDDEIKGLNLENLNNELKTIIKEGKSVSSKINKLKEEIDTLSDIEYDDKKYIETVNNLISINDEISTINNLISLKKSDIKTYLEEQICPKCKRPLDGIDNTEKINKLNNEIEDLNNKLLTLNNKKKEIEKEKDELEELKKEHDYKSSLEIKLDKYIVEKEGLELKYKTVKNKINKIKDYNKVIEHNISIDCKIEYVKSQIQIKNNEIEKLIGEIEGNKGKIDNINDKIIDNEELIKIINKEIEDEKNFKDYLLLVGKGGIKNLILKSILPILNSEIKRLLDDIVDFDVELVLNNNNLIDFILVKGDKEMPLKSGSGLELSVSSVAIRSLLGRMSSLPRPNFIVFDEVFGSISDENIEKIRPLFYKIKDMYEKVFIITMREEVKNWADTTITVVKENNISKLKIK
jgi:DNA repair exonuclease SbcCD ATPase subunit